MSSKSITEWQKCPKNTSTRLLQSTSGFNCGHCRKNHSESPDKNMVQCTAESKVDFFCVGCWDGTAWHCDDCDSVPNDSEVISCEHCGQWTHNNCLQSIDVSKEYICSHCRSSDLKSLKETIFDKNAALLNAIDKTKEWKAKFDALKNVQVQKELSSAATATQLTNIKRLNAHSVQLCGRLESQQKRNTIVETQMKQELVVVRQQKMTYKKELKKVQQQQRQLRSTLQKKTELSVVLVESVNRLRKRSNKREREHDDMIETMSRYVKRYKPQWSYTAPTGLSGMNLLLWKKYECKVRVDNGVQQYGANGVASKVGSVPLWSSLNKMFAVILSIYQLRTSQED